MRSFSLSFLALLSFGCAAQLAGIPGPKATTLAVPVYAISGLPYAAGRSTRVMSAATAVPIGDHLLVTSVALLGQSFDARQKAVYDRDIVVDDELSDGMPMHDEVTGLVFIRTKQDYKWAKPRIVAPEVGEMLAIQGYAFAPTGLPGVLEPTAATASARARKPFTPKQLLLAKGEKSFNMAGAGIFDATGEMVGVMLAGDGKTTVAIPIEVVLAAMRRAVQW